MGSFVNLDTVQAYGSFYQNQLNTTNTIQNITFESTPFTEIVWIQIPRRANITRATWLFTGFPSRALDETEDAYTWSGSSFRALYPLANAVDENYNTWATPEGPAGESYIYENYTVVKMNSHVEIHNTFRRCGTVANNCQVEFMNETDDWETIFYLGSCGATDGGSVTTNITLNESRITGNTLQLRSRVRSSNVAYCTQDSEYVDGQVVWISLPENITSDIFDDNESEYTNDTLFNGSETITSNTTAINNYLRENCDSEWDDGFCDIPINISSDSDGVLGISTINISGEYLYGKYNVTLLLEDNWTGIFPVATANITLIIFCEDSSQLFYQINESYYNDLEVYCYMVSIGTRIDYSSGDSYIREIVTQGFEWNDEIPIYLVDATEDTVLTMPIYMDDVNYRDYSLELYKTDGTNHYSITSGYFDVENKLLTYLKQNARYYLRLEGDSETRDIDYLYA
jgi:hypothetical protein